MPVALDIDLPHCADAGIVVDGRMDEAAWQTALVVDDFVVYYPEPDAPAPTSAVVRVLTDEQGFYAFFEITDPAPELVRARFARRDNFWGDDSTGIYLDTAGDGQLGYLFMTNPYGIQADATRLAGEDDQFSWDGQWTSLGHLTGKGYEVEIAIPWSGLRHPADMQRIGLSLLHTTARTGDRAGWPRRDPDISGILVQQNVLGGPGRVETSKAVVAIPELFWGWSDDGPVGERLGAWGLSPGLTLRWDPHPSASVLGTLNPDFSEIESDSSRIDVNRRFSLYYEEKRPFFLEGSDWFETELNGFLYTRSMVSPRYGVKAGTSAGGWTVAALHVLDASPAPSVSEGGGWTEDDLAGLSALETVLRVKRAVGREGFVGAYASDRSIAGSDLGNHVAGVDLRQRLSDTTQLAVALAGSNTSFADGSTATAPNGSFFVARRTRRWDTGLWGGLDGPGFRAENGFMTYDDYLGGGAWGDLRLYPKAAAVKTLSFDLLDTTAFWRTDGELRDLYVAPGAEVVFANTVSTGAGYGHGSTSFAEAWLRSDRGQVWVKGSPTRWLSLGASASAGTAPWYDESAPEVGSREDLYGGVTLRAGRRLSVGLDATRERFHFGSELAYDGWVGRARLETYATQELWARLIVDRSTFDAASSGELLLAWEPAPRRAVYLGGAARQDDAELSWQAFAKCSWLLRI